MKSDLYPPIPDDHWFIPTRTGFIHTCCDCGLTHSMSLKIVETAQGHQIHAKFKRNEMETERARSAAHAESFPVWVRLKRLLAKRRRRR
jgi:hypothetical protein